MKYIAQAYKGNKIQGYMSTSHLGIAENKWVDKFYIFAYSPEGAKAVAQRAIECNGIVYDRIVITPER